VSPDLTDDYRRDDRTDDSHRNGAHDCANHELQYLLTNICLGRLGLYDGHDTLQVVDSYGWTWLNDTNDDLVTGLVTIG
jgi:hypothetical protein